MTILRPIFGRGVAQRRLGAKVPELHQKFPLSLGAPALPVPKAQNRSSQKCCLGFPPPLKRLPNIVNRRKPKNLVHRLSDSKESLDDGVEIFIIYLT